MDLETLALEFMAQLEDNRPLYFSERVASLETLLRTRDERALRIVEEVRGEEVCRCNEGYTMRNLTDPHCGRCNEVDDACDEIKRQLEAEDG